MARFGESVDSATLVARMRKYRQQTDHSPQLFGEFLLTKAAEIFSPAELNSGFVQNELIAIFTKGLREKKIAVKLCEKDPKTLDEAIVVARSLQQKQSKLLAFGLVGYGAKYNTNNVTSHNTSKSSDRQEEDMEIGHVSRSAPSRRSQGRYAPRSSKSRPKQQGLVRCYACQRQGHIARDCPSSKKSKAQTSH